MQQFDPDFSQLHQRVLNALQQVHSQLRWKPGKDEQNLQTRIDYGHLPPESTLAAYEAIINTIVHAETANVYVYTWQQDLYPTIVGQYNNQRWLVMFSLEGIMETAFPPTDPDRYLSNDRFHHLGTVEELMTWTNS